MASANYDRMKEVKEFDESKIGVKGLSDTGITTIPSIFIHPPQTLSQLKSSSSSSSCQIPVIDLSNLESRHHRPKIIDQIREAAKTWGFFQVINHGIALSVLEETIDSIKSFHDQSHQVKAKHYSVGEENRGVKYMTNVDLHKSEVATWHDHIQVSMAPQAPEVEQIPEICRREVLAWDKHATKVADRLMELLSEGLGLEPGKFKELTFSDTRLFAGICYPHCPQPDLTMGIASHTDTQILTVLLMNQLPGLQVKHGDDWVDVKPLSGGLIINIGDFLQIVSNGEYQSVQHRVLANPFKEPRISIAMFLTLAKWRESETYGPLPELLSPEKPAIYRNFTKQEFEENVNVKGLDSKAIFNKIAI